MKRTLKRLLCGFLVMLMCFTMLPVNAFAWSYMSHMNSANIIRMEMLSYDSQYLNLKFSSLSDDYGEYTCTIPEEFYAAIFKYPDAFRAGSLGPDFYPDLVIGQMYIHPYDSEARVGSGDWLELLIESVNRLPQGSENRLRALSFTLGFMLHYCGDMFGHDFINTFSGGTFPSIMDVDITDTTDPELNNILSHMSMENYMDDLVNKEFYEDSKQIEIDAPDRFVADTLLLDSSIPSGAAKIFDQFGGAVIYIEKMLEFRNDVMDFADDLRDLTEPICMLLSSYADQWALDIDAAIYGLVDTFDRIAHRLVTGDPNPEIHEETVKDWILNGYPLSEMLGDMWDLPSFSDSAVGIIKEELSFWLEEYGWEALGIPSWLVDPPIPDWLKETFDWMFAGIKIPLALVKNLLCGLFAGILDAAVGGFVEFGVEAFEKYDDRLEKPSVQLDHRDNPYRPSGTNNFEEFDVYMDRYAAEQELLEDYDLISLLTNSDGEDVLKQLTDSEFEAFYNTMMMFKLVLMGPENFTKFLEYFGIENQTAYQKNTGEIEATVLRLDVKTMDQPDAGTDDNVWVVVKDRRTGEEVKRKMLDNSFVNDLECGDLNTFYVELPEPMKLPDIDLYLEQHDTMTTDGGWDCESVTVTPMHAGYNVFLPIGLGGNPEMDAGVTWDLQFHTALIFRTNGLKVNANTPVTHVAVRIKTGDGSYAGGTDQDVKIFALDWDHPEKYSVAVDLDKYLYDDFEDGDDDIYMVPLGQFDKATQKNKYTTLGNLTLLLNQGSDYDWYVKNVTVTPYYGNMQLTETMDFGSGWLKESEETINLSPYNKINNGTIVYKSYEEFPLTYETALDDGLLQDMDSLDASTQWSNVHVLWKSAAGRKLFFNLFKGFAPEIEIDVPENVKEGDNYDITLNFTGMWNGVNADRRNQMTGYGSQPMPAVNGTAKVTFTNTQTGQNDKVLNSVPVKNNTAVINSETYDLQSLKGLYDIKVKYMPDSEDPQYGRAEATFDNALVVRELEKYTVKVRKSCTDATAASRLLADLDVYGTVTGSGIYAAGTRFTVTAAPKTGYKIKEWIFNQVEEGVITKTDKVSGQNIKNNTFSGTSKAGTDADIVIVFEPETYNIKITTNDDRGLAGTVEGAGTYKYGERGTITATPKENFVFTGWYLDGHLLSTKQTLSFTAVKHANFTANFANAATVNMPGGSDCGYRIYVDSADSEALDSLLNSGRISRDDIVALNEDKAGSTFKVAKNSKVSFTVELEDGYERGDNFAVKAGRTVLFANKDGKYSFTANTASTTVSISGVRKIEPTPAPMITYTETDTGITFTAAGEGEVILYVNNKPVSNPYTLEWSDGETVFAVSATAQAAGKEVSEIATLDNNSFGSDVVVPVIINESEHGMVTVDNKYGAPGVETVLTVTPESGYVLDELTVASNGAQIDIHEYEGKYRFIRPSDTAVVNASFKLENFDSIEQNFKIEAVGDTEVQLYEADRAFTLNVKVTDNGEINADFQWYRCDENGKTLSAYPHPLSMGEYLTVEGGIPAAEMLATRYYRADACIGNTVKSVLFSVTLCPMGIEEEYVFPFTDVKTTDWYYSYVEAAHQMGLINGTSDTTYAPNTELTVAAAVKLATCMNILYNGGDPNNDISVGKDVWYSTYMAYALEHGIIDTDLSIRQAE
ncbi:MAG: S-layer homology domain-containing protein, partial [Clostridia bacterium]|nr:S-layer homology domain-containing protein [Clostridia bacterium]